MNNERDAMNDLEQMQQAIETIREDYNKAMRGNYAAGTRVRSAMQDVKKLAQAIRVEVVESRKK